MAKSSRCKSRLGTRSRFVSLLLAGGAFAAALAMNPACAATQKKAEKTEKSDKPEEASLPIPRFASLKANDVDMRVGPGPRYKIQWVYKRRGMPVEILRDFDNYRLVRDMNGDKGWMHVATLSGKRDFISVGGEQTLRASPGEDGDAVAHLEQGVIGEIRSCAANAEWCKVRVKGYDGWLARSEIWGIEPDEAIGQ